MEIGLVVLVLNYFRGFAELMNTVDVAVHPLVIPNWKENLGVSGGWNVGLARAIDKKLDAVVVSNDDVTFRPGTITKMVDSLQHFAMVTARNVRDDDTQEYEEGYVEHPDYACFAVKPKSFIETHGWFDENFTPAYFEDNDMHYRGKLAGTQHVCRLDALMFHEGSMTQNHDPNVPLVNHEMFENNREYYRQKWGGTPGEETFTHPFNREDKDWKFWV